MTPVLYALTRRLLGLPEGRRFISSEIAEGCDGHMTTGFGDGTIHGNGHGGNMIHSQLALYIYTDGRGIGCGTQHGHSDGGEMDYGSGAD